MDAHLEIERLEKSEELEKAFGVPRFLGMISFTQLNVTVWVCPSSFDDDFDTDCRLPIIPTSAALSATYAGDPRSREYRATHCWQR